jgi:hypothetical protein
MHVVYFASTQVSDPVTLTATSVYQTRSTSFFTMSDWLLSSERL